MFQKAQHLNTGSVNLDLTLTDFKKKVLSIMYFTKSISICVAVNTETSRVDHFGRCSERLVGYE